VLAAWRELGGGMIIVCHTYINGLGRKGKNGMGWRIVPTGLGGSACLCGCDALRLVLLNGLISPTPFSSPAINEWL